MGIKFSLFYDEKGNGIRKDAMLKAMGFCCGSLVICSKFFLASIDRRYIRTFYDARIASKYIDDYITSGVLDGSKYQVFMRNELK